MEKWCTSVIVGKDAVPRMTVNNLSRLMDEMVTSLARVRQALLLSLNAALVNDHFCQTLLADLIGSI